MKTNPRMSRIGLGALTAIAATLSLAACSSGGLETTCGDFAGMSHAKQVKVAKEAGAHLPPEYEEYAPADDGEVEAFADDILDACTSPEYVYTSSSTILDTLKTSLG